MSLFDIIKYPITDGFNNTELSVIPDAIKIPAVLQYLDYVSWNANGLITYQKHKEALGQMLQMVTDWHAARMAGGDLVSWENYRNKFRKQFIRILTEHIINYED